MDRDSLPVTNPPGAAVYFLGLVALPLLLSGCGGGSGSSSPHSVGNSYQIGVSVMGLASVTGLVLEDNGGDDLAVSNSGTYSFKTPIASGGSYAVTVVAQPAGRTCFVTSGTGTVSGADVKVLVTCPWHVAYFAEPASGGASGQIVTAYIDQSSGALFGPSSSPMSVSGLQTVAVDPGGKFLFAGTGDRSVSPATGAVDVLAIDPGTGALSAVGSPVATGFAGSLAIDPSGKALYVANGTGIASFSIDRMSGTLTAISGGSFSQPATSVTVYPRGQFLYAVNNVGPSGNTLAGYAVDPATGALSPISSASQALGSSPGSAAIDPAGKFLYVPETYGNDVRGFTIDATTGGLTPIPGLPITGISHPVFAGTDASGKFLYVDAAQGLYGYDIDAATGALAAISGSPFLTGTLSFTIDPSQNILYDAGIGYALDSSSGAPGPALNQLGPLPSAYSSLAIAVPP